MPIIPRIICPNCEAKQIPAASCRRCQTPFTYPQTVAAAVAVCGADVVIPSLEAAKEHLIRRAMQACGEPVSAAHRLGISKTTIYRKLREMGYTTKVTVCEG